MEIFFTLSIFSLIGFLTIILYLLFERGRRVKQIERLELLEERLGRLESYLYELELKVLTPDSKMKESIINMYQEGKDIPFIENALRVPRPKIEIILKQYRVNSSNG